MERGRENQAILHATQPQNSHKKGRKKQLKNENKPQQGSKVFFSFFFYRNEFQQPAQLHAEKVRWSTYWIFPSLTPQKKEENQNNDNNDQ